MTLGTQAHKVHLDLLEPREIKENLEHKVFQAIPVQRDHRVPKVNLAELAHLE